MLPRGLIVLLSLASLVVVGAGVRNLASIIGPAFLALIIVITVHPVQAWLQRHRVPSWLAVTATVGLAYAVLLGLATALAISVARLATLLPTYGPQFTDLLNRERHCQRAARAGQDRARPPCQRCRSRETRASRAAMVMPRSTARPLTEQHQ